MEEFLIIRFNKSFFTFIMAAILTTSTIALTGCNSKKTTTSYDSKVGEAEKYNSYDTSNNKKKVETIKKSEKYNVKLELEKFSLSGVFTMDKPKGWSVYKAGDYNTIAFL